MSLDCPRSGGSPRLPLAPGQPLPSPMSTAFLIDQGPYLIKHLIQTSLSSPGSAELAATYKDSSRRGPASILTAALASHLPAFVLGGSTCIDAGQKVRAVEGSFLYFWALGSHEAWY